MVKDGNKRWKKCKGCFLLKFQIKEIVYMEHWMLSDLTWIIGKIKGFSKQGVKC